MNTLLIFFALPVATVLLSVVLQTILKCPILVAITAFAAYLIVTYAVYDSSFLVFTILYTIIAFLSAYISCIIFQERSLHCKNNIENNLNFANMCGENNQNFEGLNYNVNNQNNSGIAYRCRK